MEEIGKELILTFQVGGATIKVDIFVLIMSWITIAIIVVGALLLRRGLKLDRDFEDVPSKPQALLEIALKALRTQLGGGFESRELGNKLFPLLATMGVYIAFMNWIAIIPGMRSPTETINVPISMGLLVFALAHYYRFRIRGPVGYLKSYMEGPGVMGIIMIPLSLVGELAKPVSHSFRLFGNLMGGAIMLLVISNLIPLWVFPLHVFLNFFYLLFVGGIQAMVFTLLATAYISMAEEDH